MIKSETIDLFTLDWRVMNDERSIFRNYSTSYWKFGRARWELLFDSIEIRLVFIRWTGTIVNHFKIYKAMP